MHLTMADTDRLVASERTQNVENTSQIERHTVSMYNANKFQRIYTAVASNSVSSCIKLCIQILCNSCLAGPERSSSRTAGYTPDRRIDLQSQQFDKHRMCTSTLNSTRSCHRHMMQQHFQESIKCAGERNLTTASWEE